LLNASFIRRVRLKLRRLTGRADPVPFPPEVALLLDPEWYAGHYRDVSLARRDPLEHFLAHGVGEFRDPNALFDTQWYLAAYPDVAQAGVPPVVHYVRSGAAEMRDPGPLFSTREYLETFPWLGRVGLNPLVHRILSGYVAPAAPPAWTAPPDHVESPVSKAITDIVFETIRAFDAVEPDLAALASQRLQDFPVIPQLSAPCERAWAELYRTLTRRPQRVIFVGGLTEPNDALLSLVRAAERAGVLPDTLIVSTDEIQRPAPAWLPLEAQWRAYSDLGVWLEPHDRAVLTTTLLHSLRPAQAMLADSRAAWSCLLTYGPALGRLTDLFGWVPSGLRPDARMKADFLPHFRTCLPYLRAFYMEDERLADDLSERFGLPPADRSKLIVLRRPWRAEAERSGEGGAKARPHGGQSRVLWIGDPDERAESSLRHAVARFSSDLRLELWRTYKPVVPGREAEGDTIRDFDCVLLTLPPEGAADVLLETASARVPLLHLGQGELGLGLQRQEIEVDTLFARGGLEDPIADISARAARRLRRLLGSDAERQSQLQRLAAYVSARHRPEDFISVLTRDGGFLAPSSSQPEKPR
jgi:hypothetical protein